MLKKNVIIHSILLFGVSFVYNGVVAQNTSQPQGDTVSYRLKKNSQPSENGEKVLFKNGEKIVIKEGESNPYGTSRWETDEQGNKILVIRKNNSEDTTSRKLHAYKREEGHKGKVLYRNGEKINVKSLKDSFDDEGEWQVDEDGRKVYVYTNESGKKLFVYPSEESETNEQNLSENELLQLYPNPSPNNCNILYSVGKSGNVVLELINQEGKTVEILLNEEKEEGTHTFRADLSKYNKGMYYVRYTNHQGVVTKKLLKLE